MEIKKNIYTKINTPRERYLHETLSSSTTEFHKNISPTQYRREETFRV